MLPKWFFVAATAVFVVTPAAQAAPGPGPGMCQYLGTNYPIYYPCDQYQPWLPYGTYDNPPAGSGPITGRGVPGLGDAKPSS